MTGLWKRRVCLLRGSNWISVHNEGYLSEVAMGQVFLRIRRFPYVIITPLVLLTLLHPHVALNQKDKRSKPADFPKSSAFFFSEIA